MAKNTFTAMLFAFLFAAGAVSAEQQSSSSMVPSLHVSSPAAGDAAAAVTPSTNVVSEPVKTADPQKPVQLQLFYEALCSDTVKFVRSQLLPTYEKLGKFIGITYNPFSQGDIKVVDNKTVYTCPREQAECDADRVHACAIAHISNQDSLLKFVNCSLVQGFDLRIVPIEKCGNESGIETEIISKISTCFNGSEGYTYLSGYLERAHAAKVSYVPHIVINQVYSNETQELAQQNFKKVVCLQIPAANRPDECKDIVSGSSTVVVGVLPIFVGVYYIIRMF